MVEKYSDHSGLRCRPNWPNFVINCSVQVPLSSYFRTGFPILQDFMDLVITSFMLFTPSYPYFRHECFYCQVSYARQESGVNLVTLLLVFRGIGNG